LLATPFRKTDNDYAFTQKVKKFDRDLGHLSKKHHIKITHAQTTGGAWKDEDGVGMEPSVEIRVRFEGEKHVRAFTQEIVDKYNQDGALLFWNDKENANSKLWEFTEKISFDEAIGIAQNFGTSLTYKNEKIKIIEDEEHSVPANAWKVLKKLNPEKPKDVKSLWISNSHPEKQETIDKAIAEKYAKEEVEHNKAPPEEPRNREQTSFNKYIIKWSFVTRMRKWLKQKQINNKELK
jgi:hypothetical protein